MFYFRSKPARILKPPTFNFRDIQINGTIDTRLDVSPDKFNVVRLKTFTKITIEHVFKKTIHVSVLVIEDIRNLTSVIR
jgi:hypothetical protein